MDNRFIFGYGVERGLHIQSNLADGTQAKELRFFLSSLNKDIFSSPVCRRIITAHGNNIQSIKADGSNDATIGIGFSQAKRYLFSTGNRHVYAVLTDTISKLWTLYSELLNGGSPSILGSSLKEEALVRILYY
jgi:hypothetical protein